MLVLAHHVNGPEADAGVAADRGPVVGGRIDRQPTVAAVTEQVPREVRIASLPYPRRCRRGSTKMSSVTPYPLGSLLVTW
jgi:hypothetical protein